MRKITTAILTRERSEEEKLRRHLHGDKGAKFSGGKIPKIDLGQVIGTVTTMVTKDLLLIESYEDSDSGQDRPVPAGQDNINRGYMPGFDRRVTLERGMDESDIGC